MQTRIATKFSNCGECGIYVALFSLSVDFSGNASRERFHCPCRPRGSLSGPFRRGFPAGLWRAQSTERAPRPRNRAGKGGGMCWYHRRAGYVYIHTAAAPLFLPRVDNGNTPPHGTHCFPAENEPRPRRMRQSGYWLTPRAEPRDLGIETALLAEEIETDQVQVIASQKRTGGTLVSRGGRRSVGILFHN